MRRAPALPLDDTERDDASPEPTPEDLLLRRERTARVRKAIAALPRRARDVVLLRTYADLPFREIASLLRISESSAKVIFFRAKATLRSLLEK